MMIWGYLRRAKVILTGLIPIMYSIPSRTSFPLPNVRSSPPSESGDSTNGVITNLVSSMADRKANQAALVRMVSVVKELPIR